MPRRKGPPVRQQHTREFTLEAVRLLQGGKPTPELAQELGVRVDLLRQWQRQIAATAARGDGAGVSGAAPPASPPPAASVVSPDEELRRLRRENARLQQEVEFPKKAAAYFPKAPR